jgi:hypothetical protein
MPEFQIDAAALGDCAAQRGGSRPGRRSRGPIHGGPTYTNLRAIPRASSSAALPEEIARPIGLVVGERGLSHRAAQLVSHLLSEPPESG